MHFREKLNALLADVQNNGIDKHNLSTLHENPKDGFTFLNPMFFIK